MNKHIAQFTSWMEFQGLEEEWIFAPLTVAPIPQTLRETPSSELRWQLLQK